MANSRVSNKQVLEAIENGFNQLAAALNQQPQAVASEPTVPKNTGETSVKLDAKYKAHMESKFAAYAAKVGEPVVGYAYKKSNGRTGLWSVPQSKFADAKIKNLIGAIGIYEAS